MRSDIAKRTNISSDIAKRISVTPPKCVHQEFLDSLGKPKSNREYWILTEIFVYVHKGKDFCNCPRGDDQ